MLLVLSLALSRAAPPTADGSLVSPGWGRVAWTDTEARHAVIAEWHRDDATPFQGSHGELRYPPEVWVYDLTTGEGTQVDDLLAAGATLAVVARDGAPWLLDARTGQWSELSLPGLDDEDDGSCRPRGLDMAVDEDRLVYLATDPYRVVHLDPRTGETDSRPRDRRLWKAVSLGAGWTLEFDLLGEALPQRDTTCVCVLGMRMGTCSEAAVQGVEAHLVDGTGVRAPTEQTELFPLSPTLAVRSDDYTVVDVHGEAQPTPGDCQVVAASPEHGAGALYCEPGPAPLWFDGALHAIGGRVLGGGKLHDLHVVDGWIGVTDERRIGRLRLADREIAWGPRLGRHLYDASGDWWISPRGRRVTGYRLSDGAVRVQRWTRAEVRALRDRPGWADPPLFEGCELAQADPGSGQGPWFRRCRGD